MLTVLTATLVALAGILALAAPGSAQTTTTRSAPGDTVQKAKAARAELEAITARIEQATNAFHTNQLELEQATRRAAESQARFTRARANLNVQAAALVRSGGANILESLLNDDPKDAVDRLETVDVVLRRRTDWVLETNEAQAAYAQAVADIETRTAADRRLNEQLRTERAKLDAKFREAKQALLAGGGLASTKGVDGIAEVAGGIACPAEAPYSFIDSWGFARSGGRHHQGTDIMAPLGATAFAYADGVVTKASSIDKGLAGREVMIRHPGGVDTWYFHMDTVRVTKGQHVQAGQVIGTVGNTGNAVEGGEHIHFEYHIGGSPVNPYQFVRRACPQG